MTNKNIVLCCDGTANEFKRDRTNVIKLYQTLVRDAEQVAYYHPGVGTMEAVGAITSGTRKLTKLLGLAFGYGLENDVRDAYSYLMEVFDPGDRIYLFGFSRGAYTVRAVASLLHMYGLIPRGNQPLIPYAIRMMLATQRKKTFADVLKLAAEFKATFSAVDCRPHFVGVWDTVSSVGWVANPLHLPYTASNPDIAVGRHAVAIDERRAFFRQNLWWPKPNEGPKDFKQVWFAGVHCDVGGGYPEAESGLSKLALEWMLSEARLHGLRLDKDRYDPILGRNGSGLAPPDPGAMMHNSLTVPWWPVEFVPKKHRDPQTGHTGLHMNLFNRRAIRQDDAMIHASVYERMGLRPDYSPELPSGAVQVTTTPLP